jgi:hypothetical protein
MACDSILGVPTNDAVHFLVAALESGHTGKAGESVIQKVMRYALSSKFVMIENTQPAGHLYEIPHVTKAAECVTVVLQEEGKGATWMFEDAYAKHRHWAKITHEDGNLEHAVQEAAAWAEKFVAAFAVDQKAKLPWLRAK